MKSQKGFSLIETFLLFVMLVVIGLVGLVIYKHQHKPIVHAPVAIFKSLCFTRLCLSYPHNWQEKTSIPYTPKGSQPNPVTYGVDVTSPDGKMVVQLLSYASGPGPNDTGVPDAGVSQAFTTLAIKAAPHFPGADIVKGIEYSKDNYATQNLNLLPYTPVYALVPDSAVKQAGLVVGQTTNLTFSQDVMRPKGSNPSYAADFLYFQFGTIYESQKTSNGLTVGMKSFDVAKAWLQTPNAQVAGQILQTLRPE